MAIMKKPLPVLLAMVLAWAWAAPARAGVDYSIYAGLLKRHVKNGVVSYAGFKADEAKLDRFLDLLAKADPAKMTRNQSMAFYINAYNAWTIKLILSKYPGIKSIRDIGWFLSGPWKKKIVRLKQGLVTLDYLEHDVLRPRYKDPRVHFAINCASKSCPPLLAEPYLPQTLDRQLNQVARAFINDPHYTYYKDGVLHVSSIFDWFSEDFGYDVAKFVLKYADEKLAREIRARGKDLDIKYLDYDWSLNGK